MKTQIIKVSQAQGQGHSNGDSSSPFGHWSSPPPQEPSPQNDLKASQLNTWVVPPIDHTNLATLVPLQQAASYLRQSDIPVAFPTETVYGLGADATCSAAVKGIYKAKGRPSDNPLIVHVCDLDMLRDLLSPSSDGSDPIPEIYHPLIAKFWPGPLTILLPNPSASSPSSSTTAKPKLSLAPEVTATLSTFGARMPSSPLARSLIKLANRPLAAPSANASTKPSPTTAQHVLDDLNGRIELILDGGSCSVGVESTVVDGLCDPPVVLRPGGVSIEELKTVKGWENVEKAYKDYAEHGDGGTNGNGEKKDVAPRAPGMKYKHYSPRAKVILYEAEYLEGQGKLAPGAEEGGVSKAEKTGVFGKQDLIMAMDREKVPGKNMTVGVIRTTRWPVAAGLSADTSKFTSANSAGTTSDIPFAITEGDVEVAPSEEDEKPWVVKVLDVDLGKDIRGVAHGLFAALRELDRRGADIIFVEGVKDGEDQDIAAAVMNRLRKAASVIRS
ncbi:DHBP synthase RibB-like alpha/beta domain containing protein [Naviculisporaceae sp. PSN 640]